MNLLQINIRSYTTNKEELIRYINQHSIDMIILADTKLKNYTFTIQNRQDNPSHGGVAIITKNIIPISRIQFPTNQNNIIDNNIDNNNLESTYIKVYVQEPNSNNKKFFILGSIYIPSPDISVLDQHIANIRINLFLSQ